jgi:prevent-host-death family protein
MAMDQLIPAAEANRSFSRLLREVQGGQSFIVTAHGKPVARIVPCDATESARDTAREKLLARLAAQPVTDVGRWSRDELYER